MKIENFCSNFYFLLDSELEPKDDFPDAEVKNASTDDFMAILERNSAVLQQATEKNKEMNQEQKESKDEHINGENNVTEAPEKGDQVENANEPEIANPEKEEPSADDDKTKSMLIH